MFYQNEKTKTNHFPVRRAEFAVGIFTSRGVLVCKTSITEALVVVVVPRRHGGAPPLVPLLPIGVHRSRGGEARDVTRQIRSRIPFQQPGNGVGVILTVLHEASKERRPY